MKYSSLRQRMLLGALGMTLCLAHDTLWSAEAANSSHTNILEEIIVTARRRDESSMAVPMSLTRLDGATLEDLQYRDLDEILSLSPGVLVYGGGDRVSSQITIRGVVTPGAMIEPGNAVYVDEVYASGMYTILPAFYDIQSVQVLKGPQAGLYGRNTTGGAVLVTTGQPTDELSARVDASYAQLDTREASGTINVPFSDALRLRGTGWYSDSNGGYYQDKILDQKLDTTHQTGGRLTFAVLPDDNTSLTVTAEYVDINDGGFSFAGGVVKGAHLGPPPLAPESRRNVLRDDLDGTDQDSARINGRLEVNTGAGDLVVVAGWRRITVREPDSDFDGTAYSASPSNPASALTTPAPQVFTLDGRDTSRQAEVRFLTPDDSGTLKAMFGVTYFEETLRFNDAITPVRDFAATLAELGLNGRFEHHVDQKTRSWAGFGDLIWVPVDTVELTVDLRYTRDRKAIDSSQTATGLYSSPFVRLPSLTLDTSDTFDNWSPGITLAYKPDDAFTVFAKYVRGFRAGGFNALAYDPALLPYQSEEAENYELGGKTLLFDRRLEMGASIFYLRIDNALLPRQDPGAAVSVFPLQNVGVAKTTGLEVDLSAGIATGLTLAASAGIYNNDQSNAGPESFDKRPFVPDYTASLVVDYEYPLAAAITGIATLGYRYRSGGRVVSDRPSPEIKMDSYNLIDAQLGIRVGKVQIAGFVQNALDDNYVIGNHELGVVQAIILRPTGINTDTTRALARDPGSVYGLRVTVAL